MVDGDDPTGADVAIEAAVGLLEKLPPHLRLHEQGVFGAPVVVGEQHVGLQAVDEHFGIGQPELGDVLNQLVHLVRVLIERGEGVFKIHEEVALLEDAGAHKAGDQAVVPGGLPGGGPGLLPPLGAVGLKIGGVDHLPPTRHVGADGEPAGVDGDGAGGVLWEIDGHAPPVHRGGAPLPVAPEEDVDGVSQIHGQGLVLAQLALRLSVGTEQLQEYLFGRRHDDHSSES